MKKVYTKRIVVCLILVLSLLFVGLARLFLIATDDSLLEAANSQSTYSVRIYRNRGTIYDRNMFKLTNIKDKQMTVFSPTEQGIISAATVLKGEEKTKALETLKTGYPASVTGGYKMSGTTVVDIPNLASSNLAVHLTGYTDATGHGVCGVEQGMDNELFGEDYVTVKYTKDSLSNILTGVSAEVDYGSGNTSDVVLTLDMRIQKIVEEAITDTGSCAAVVIDAETGEIIAMASAPTYDKTNIGASLESDGSPFVNKVINAYSVGSVFKPLIAAVALENSYGDYKTYCNGYVNIDGRSFKCHKSSGHGEVDMETALKESCNVYFYELGNVVGGDKIYDFAKRFSFGESINIGCNIYVAQGDINSKEELKNSKSSVANLSIGQGKLISSPVTISLLYEAIINSGYYHSPNLLYATIKKGLKSESEQMPITRVMSQKTANTLKSYLIEVVTSGTGQKAYFDKVVSGGKTGTAQTGQIKDGRAILNGWFSGFAEIKGKNYVITVMKEDVNSGSDDCAPIFREITEKIYNNIL